MLKSLWLDPNHQFSASKFWTTVAYATATVIMILEHHRVEWEMLLAYTAVVGGSEVAKKLITLRYAVKPSPENHSG